eukprot:CAMPEP_0170457142 /NCGR_PEP_ID=MMETSP0123-20130129/4531_1 /TAXON_ID=182087 /ORGANISM="Favella ehrenbergii, Strain Fehren 1" /LENGTH=44 /DNA_ID= /DNA_START= /DNA_END= /DNA_ORIENTATION=
MTLTVGTFLRIYSVELVDYSTAAAPGSEAWAAASGSTKVIVKST